jgi:hypothetical protein
VNRPSEISTVPESQWVDLPAEFALAPVVVAGAQQWPLRVGMDEGEGRQAIHLRCGRCDQSILPLATPSGAYRVRITDMSASLLAHLQQRHGWTREAQGV